jgi:glutamyl-tRNA reductase
VTLLVVGISHRSAPVSLLDRVALVDDSVERLQVDLLASQHVAESLVLSTCNRVEVYAEVTRFHGGVVDVTETLAKVTGVPRDELTPHLYVRYEDRAVQHLFEVAAGLDSMVVGEQQILGQVRAALRSAQDTATAGKNLNDLAQAALRVGKRVHHDTGIDRAGSSVVSVALDLASAHLGGLVGRRALVLGAGAMSSLAAAHLVRHGVREVVVANRTFERGQHLAEQVGGTAVELSNVPAHLASIDVLVSCTGSTGLVLTTDEVRAARGDSSAALVVVDLALPHDTEESLGALPGVHRLDLADVAAVPAANAPAADVELARSIVADEVRAHGAVIAAHRVEPIVVSLRARAEQVVESELGRLRLRVPDLDDDATDEVARSLRRVVSTLLHTPTVRMKQLAGDPDGARYATALHHLFDLDPEAIEAVTAAEDAAAGARGPQTGESTYDELLGGAE